MLAHHLLTPIWISLHFKILIYYNTCTHKYSFRTKCNTLTHDDKLKLSHNYKDL